MRVTYARSSLVGLSIAVAMSWFDAPPAKAQPTASSPSPTERIADSAGRAREDESAAGETDHPGAELAAPSGTTTESPTVRTDTEAREDPACSEQAPVFDPSTPRLELQLSGGYAAFFHTWRQTNDGFMAPGAHADGLYHGPVFRGEAAFAMGSLSLAAIYTHTWLTHDGTADPVQFGFLSGELGLQCACRGSSYVWSFGLEVGADMINAGRTTVFVSIEHRSMFYVWEELFLGFDVDFATFVGLTTGGASGGGIIGNLFVGYSFG